MREECSRKITFLNYVLAVLIVLLHSDNRSTADFSNIIVEDAALIYEISRYVAKMAVPTFFALSGYLFFRNCKSENLSRKLIGRVKSILIPYLIWNVGFYGIYALLNRIPFIGNRINFEIPEITIKVLLFENHANPPLWFLPKLFVLQLMSVIVLWLFVKLKKWNLIWIIGFLIADCWLDFGYSNVLHWVAVYYGAGFVAYFKSEEVEVGKPFVSIPKWGSLCIAILLLIVQNFALQWIFAPFVCWAFLSLFNNVPCKEYMKTSFFIFCTHYFVVLMTRKLLLILLGASQVTIVLIYIVTFAFTTIALTLVGAAFKKLLPKTYSILCGGR